MMWNFDAGCILITQSAVSKHWSSPDIYHTGSRPRFCSSPQALLEKVVTQHRESRLLLSFLFNRHVSRHYSDLGRAPIYLKKNSFRVLPVWGCCSPDVLSVPIATASKHWTSQATRVRINILLTSGSFVGVVCVSCNICQCGQALRDSYGVMDFMLLLRRVNSRHQLFLSNPVAKYQCDFR